MHRFILYGLLFSLLLTGCGGGPPAPSSGAIDPTDPTSTGIVIDTPVSRAIFQQSGGAGNIPVNISVDTMPAGHGIEAVLDKGTPGERSEKKFGAPYQFVFFGVPCGEHTLSACRITITGQRIGEFVTVDRVGVGDIIVAVGDSITYGEDDDIYTDDWSADGRNGPVTDIWGTSYGGFEPILNNLLTNAKGYPHSVINEGCSGDLAYRGLDRIDGILAKYPTAGMWLIAFGTNDSNHNVSASVYESNLRSIIARIHAVNPSAKIFLPKVFYWPKDLVQEYHGCMQNIISSTPNVCMGADLETSFKQNHEQFDHMANAPGTWFSPVKTHHPNGIGIQKMAELWRDAILSAM